MEALIYMGVEINEFFIILIILSILMPFIFIHNFHHLSKSSYFAFILVIFTVIYMLLFNIEYIDNNEGIVHGT